MRWCKGLFAGKFVILEISLIMKKSTTIFVKKEGEYELFDPFCLKARVLAVAVGDNPIYVLVSF